MENNANNKILRLSPRRPAYTEMRNRDNDFDRAKELEKLIGSSQFMSDETKRWLLQGLRK